VSTPPPPLVARAVRTTLRRDALVKAARALWWPLMVIFGAGAVGGFLNPLPAAFVSVFAGAVWVTTTWLFYKAITTFSPIEESQAKHLVEAKAGVGELAPLTSQGDRPVSGDAVLWAWHQGKLATATLGLTKPASPILTRQDGVCALTLLTAVCLCAWQPMAAARALTFDLSPLVGDRDLVLDAWAQPPDYTGLPIVRLSRDTPKLSLPEGSTVHARMDGATGAPRLIVSGKAVPMQRERGDAWAASALFNNTGMIALDRFGKRAQWQVSVVRDKPPTIVAAEPIKTDAKGRLDVAFTAKDDYAIASASLRISPIERLEGLGATSSFDTPIPLDGEALEDGSRRVFLDVADHVLTGLPVTIRLVVRDRKGQESLGPEARLIMPSLEWRSSLAKALQEQRLLILRENRPYQYRPPAMATLFDAQLGLPIKLDLFEPLAGAPPGIARAEALLSATLNALRQAGASDVAMMAFRLARERIALSRHARDAHEVAPLLWQLALQAEAGDQSPAQQRLAAAKNALEQALNNGASDEEIARLNQELREAVGERLQELAEQGGSGGGGTQGEGGNSVSSGDIDKMLRDLEQSGSNGARQDALDQLDQLAQLMDNLQSGGGSGSGGGDNGTGQQSGTNPLDDAMREQRDLTDQTGQRQSQDDGSPASDLADRQEDLADRLGGGQQNQPQRGSSSPPNSAADQVQANKQQAAQAMREAAEALRRGDLSGAQDAQSRAEQALQQAATAQSAANGDNQGDQDPLGRASRRLDDGRETKVPNQVEKRRARDVREELRRRQADPRRDGQERDYLDRLLQGR
jgi:hypothetical protein